MRGGGRGSRGWGEEGVCHMLSWEQPVSQHVDEVVNSQLKQERYTEKMAKLQKG